MIGAAEFTSPRVGLPLEDIRPLARGYMAAVLSRLRRAANPATGGNADAPDLSAPSIAEAETAWSPEIGAAFAAVRRGRREHAVLQAALGLAAHGPRRSWRLNLPEPTPVSFAGHRLVAQGLVSCRGDGDNVVIGLVAEGQAVELPFQRTGQGWRLDASTRALAGAPAFLSCPGFEDRYVLAAANVEDDAGDELPPWPPGPCVGAAPGAAAAQTSRALELIKSLGEHYREWLAPMFRGVVASHRKVSTLNRSASCPEQPGVIHVAFPVDHEQLAEMLVHEVSHQYFFLIGYASPLTSTEDENLYYSSLKKLPRRIDRILLALHATANMAVFWTDLIETHGATPARLHFQSMALDHTRRLGAIVDRSPGLTPAGRRMWEIQSTLLRDRGLAFRDA